MSIYKSLGLDPIINAAGAVTRLGGAPMPAPVLTAFKDAAKQWVPLELLQAAASRMIAQCTGAEAGLVSAGSAAALTLGAAAIMTGNDLSRMEKLPHSEDFPHQFIVSRDHRSGYDHAVRAAGARFVEVGFNEVVAGAGVRRAEVWEYEAAIGPRTAGIFYTYGPASEPALPELVKMAKRRKLPVMVDAAGELPPRSNLFLAAATGADLVAFSGGKAIRGPQSTGILCGRGELIASAAVQMLDMDDIWELWEPPADFIDKSAFPGLPRHGVGRALKVSKEEIVALVTALAMFEDGSYDQDLKSYQDLLNQIVELLDGLPLSCDVSQTEDERPPVLTIKLDPAAPPAIDICRKLRNGSPQIHVGQGQLREGALVIHPLCLDAEQALTIANRIRSLLS